MKKVNSTVALTLALLTVMLGAGIISAAAGFAIGSEALKGITQPDARPTNKVNRKNSSGREELVILKEEDILNTVKTGMGINKPSPNANPSQSPTSKPEAKNQNSTAKFPITAQDKGVTLEVTNVRRQGDFLMLDVALKNDSPQPVKFLYSFLNISDDKGNALSADPNGLPTDLAAKSDRYTGTLTLSSVLLENAQKLSLQLTDYPDQKLQLKLADIPVK